MLQRMNASAVVVHLWWLRYLQENSALLMVYSLVAARDY